MNTSFNSFEAVRSQYTSEWAEMIEDLVNGAGYSYSEIARKANLSPSEIQKLAKGRRREPRFKVYRALLSLYWHTFYSSHRQRHCENYIRIKKHACLNWLNQICQEVSGIQKTNRGL
ncbi:MAG: hypothetical protein K0S08_1680 [Gammaproteobacteria bacterium]|jgi:transcriptional regulator with XRE-family HTH domain|nr:hypothetical protein [Gammaproteobacteria bacterium]